MEFLKEKLFRLITDKIICICMYPDLDFSNKFLILSEKSNVFIDDRMLYLFDYYYKLFVKAIPYYFTVENVVFYNKWQIERSILQDFQLQFSDLFIDKLNLNIKSVRHSIHIQSNTFITITDKMSTRLKR